MAAAAFSARAELWSPIFRIATAVLAAAGAGVCAAGAVNARFDVVVYGATSSGVMAAVQAGQMGKSVVLLEPGQHAGGMTSGGLSSTDIGDPTTVGGLARQFYQYVYQYYQVPPRSMLSAQVEGGPATAAPTGSPTFAAPMQWQFEPHVAEAVFNAMMNAAGVVRYYGEQLDRSAGVAVNGGRITSLTMLDGDVFTGKEFIDATYEGDLMAAAGVPYRLGREGTNEYGEALAGVYPDVANAGEVDPFVIAGNPTSGLLPGVQAVSPGALGQGDGRVQQYNQRLCFTNVAANRLPITQPAGYDPTQYELAARYLQAHPNFIVGKDVVKLSTLPNAKVDVNATDSFSTDMIGDASDDWTEASYAERAQLLAEYETYTQGYFWFLANDSRVPPAIQAQMQSWGPAADEFLDNGGWPTQLYVREARRMVGSYVISEQDAEGTLVASDPVALASYGLDSHKVTIFVDSTGTIQSEGFFSEAVEPFPISYRALVPPPGGCANLLVPVCLSATHVAYNTIRLEPVYMMLGQAAGTAACQAIDEGADVQALDYPILAARLQSDLQILSWTPAMEASKPTSVASPSPAAQPTAGLLYGSAAVN